VGFAYDLTGAGKHVLRGGFGFYYDNVFQNIPLWMEQMAHATVYQQRCQSPNLRIMSPA